MRKPLLSLISLCALCLLLGLGRGAWADDRSDARAHYQAGVQLYNGGDYRGAIHEFQAAQQLLPADLNNYNLALCYDKLGDASSAIQFYRSYLDKVPNSDKRAEIEASISRLDAAAKAAQQKKADEDRAREEADRRAAEEHAAREAAASQPAPQQPPAPNPVAGSVGGSVSVGVQPNPMTPPAPTGDAQLDQVQGVDINQLRAQRGMGGQPVPANGQQQLNAQGQMNGQAGAPPAQPGQPGQPNTPMANNPAGQPLPGDKPPAADPIYKKWWFWVVVGVSVYVIYEIANDNSQPMKGAVARQNEIPMGRGRMAEPAPASGFTLLRW